MRVVGKERIDRSRINRVLVRATNWVGDMVMTLPALEAVRENFPNSRIGVLARPWVVPLLEDHPSVDEVIPYGKGRGFIADLMELVRVSGQIRKMRFDLAILFQNAFEAALLAFLGNVRYRVGYNTDGRGLLLTHSIIRDNSVLEQHQVEYYLSILRAMGWDARSVEPALSVGHMCMEEANSLLSSEGIGSEDLLIGLSPGAVFGSAKRWPPERFAAIGDRAVERWGAKIVLLGSRGERDICKVLSGSMRYTPLDLCGRTTLTQAVALIKRCRLFVTNDSGLMHVAAALNVPMVAIFGSTDHVATGPRSRKAKVVRHEVDCAPCLKPECPTDFRCMLGIEPNDVWKEMEHLKREIG